MNKPNDKGSRIHLGANPLERRLILLAALLACTASMGLYTFFLIRPFLFTDDFWILVRSWTWDQAWANLWVPSNEHAMPAGRLSTWLLIQLARRPSLLPYFCTLQGPLALVAGMVLLFLFVRRELGSPFLGLLAMSLFGVSTVFQQAIAWFAASFSVLALDFLLLAFLAAQRWRQQGRPFYLILCGLWSALSLAWFASGILVGFFCGFYLLLPAGKAAEDWENRWSRAKGWAVRFLQFLVPLLGTGLFLAISLPRTAHQIMHLPHYQGLTATESFLLLTGLRNTLHSIVENLLLGSLGISNVDVSVPVVVLIWVILVPLAGWWYWSAPAGRRFMLLGTVMILTSYLLVYSARATWGFRHWNMYSWSRYHLLPQLGLTLFVAGGLSRWPSFCSPGLSGPQMKGTICLIALLFTFQFPRAFLAVAPSKPDNVDLVPFLVELPQDCWDNWNALHGYQQVGLRQIEQVDALCRRHGISAAGAQEVLPYLDISGNLGHENCWQFLRGSPTPDATLTREQRYRLLQPCLPP